MCKLFITDNRTNQISAAGSTAIELVRSHHSPRGGTQRNNSLQPPCPDSEYRVYTHVRAEEDEVLRATDRTVPSSPLLRTTDSTAIQPTPAFREALESAHTLLLKPQSLEYAMGFVKGFSGEIMNKLKEALNDPNTAHLFQEVMYTLPWLSHMLGRVECFKDAWCVMDYLTRVHCGKPLTKFMMDRIYTACEPTAQSFDWSVLKGLLTNYEAIKTHPVVIKFVRMISVGLAGGFLATLGMESNVAQMWAGLAEIGSVLVGHCDFVSAALDLVYFVGERITSFITTGDWRNLLHTPSSHSAWVDRAFILFEHQQGLSNPAVLGFDYHTHVKDLCDAIKEGEEIRKYLKAADQKEAVAGVLSKLRTCYNDVLIKDACGKFRESPFSMLVATGSGVGKSSFVDLCVAHYANLRGKPLEDEYIYTRTATEDHYNNFKTSMWACILDDIGSINPNKGTEDPSLKDILQIVNNIPFSPPQAALEDKGRTPFMCELVIATTNTADLKAHCWFNNPQAIRRRLPYVIETTPKAEYRREGTLMLDPAKVPVPLPGYYPDIWDITVKKISVSRNTNGTEKVIDDVVILQTSNIYIFIQHFNGWVDEHRRDQAAFMAARTATRAVQLCLNCRLPSTVCSCGSRGPTVPQPYNEDPHVAAEVLPEGGFRIVSVDEEPEEKLVAQADDVRPQMLGNVVGGLVGVAGSAYVAHRLVKSSHKVVRGNIGMLRGNPLNLLGLIADDAVNTIGEDISNLAGAVVVWTADKVKKALRSWWWKKWDSISPKLKTMMKIAAVLAGLGVTYRFLRKEFPEHFEDQDPQVSVEELNSVGRTPAKGTDTENVWRKETYAPSEPLGRLSVAWASLDLTKVASLVSRNTVWCRTDHGEGRHSTFRALCLGGHVYVVPNHVLPMHCEDWMMQVIHENDSEGCNGNIKFRMMRSSVLSHPDKELAFFEILHMPVRRNLMELLPPRNSTFDGPGRMCVRQANGSLKYITVKRAMLKSEQNLPQFAIVTDVCHSIMEADTSNGECGSPVVVTLGHGYTIAGVHSLGGSNLVSLSPVVYRELAKEVIAHFGRPIVESDAPDLREQAFTTNVSARCTARFIEEGTVQVFGSFEGFKRQPKSTACDTLLTPHLVARGFEKKHGPAPMKGYTAVHLALKPMVMKTHLFDTTRLIECTDSFFNDVIRELPRESLDELQMPFNLDVAINGMPGVKFVDSMNFNTSAGFPYNKSKRLFMSVAPAFGEWQHPVVISDAIKQEVALMWTKMSEGIRCCPIFMQHLKDEALPLRKVKAGKARVMMGGPFAWSICVRMALLPFVRVMQMHKYVFECAPGTNATSYEWQRLYEYLTAYGTDNFIGGDFQTFDKSMGALVILEAFRFIARIITAAGGSEVDARRVFVIGEDVAFAFCNYNGDLMMFFGSNPSGHPLTVIINCIVNSLYMRYCYRGLNPDEEVWSFKKNVRLITYGDDNGSTSLVKWFNHTALVGALAEVGIIYTMADKSTESVAFISIEQFTFLQRGFRWSEDLQCFVAILNKDSIWRSVMIQVPSTTETPQKQIIDTVRSAVSELFLYGREEFDRAIQLFKEVVDAADLSMYVEKGTFPAYSALLSRYVQVSKDYIASEPITTRKLLGPVRWKILDEDLGVADMSTPVGSQTSAPEDSYCSLSVQSLCKVNESVGHQVTSEGHVPKVFFRTGVPGAPDHEDCGRSDGCVMVQRDAPTNNTTTMSQGELVDLPTLVSLMPQSEELEDGIIRMSTHENLMFADAGDSGSVTMPMVSYRPDADEIAHLGSYLSRPVVINSFSWAEGATPTLLNQFTPWSLFFNHPPIRNKLANFARLRAKLHLKFVVNASPFYYGAVRAAYCPLDGGLRDIVESVGDQVKFSQFPGKMMYPAEMTTFEMDLPFLWPRSWLNLEDLSEFDEMGRVSYINYSNLRSANGTTGQNVTITCYAWATDVELAGLTSGLVMQSDEYSDPGPISGPASAVASVASKLTDAPIIGGLARATEVGASAISSVARMFGYSNPPVVSDVMPYMPKSFHAFSSVDTSVPSDKLSVDPKNEVTIDTKVAGDVGEDDLVITKFCGRESWIAGSLWTEAYAPGTQIMVIPVTPRTFSVNAGTGQTLVNATPACHVATMFEQWRGSMTYKFHFVKSRYHTGRVQISWDPQGVPNADAETTTLTRIVDLQVESEVTFTVPFKAGAPWLSTDGDGNSIVVTTAGVPTLQPTRYNGYIRLTVLNELTGPSSLQQIDVLAFSEGGKDLEFSVPNELPLWSFLTVQSLEEQDIVPGSGGARDVSTNSVTVGETVPSLRPLLHRASYHHRQFLGNPLSAANTFRTSALYTHVNYVPRFPVEYGFSTQAVNYATGLNTASKFQFQFSPNHPLGWVTNCFVGYRGSIVHHYNVVANGGQLVDELKAEMDPRTHILDVAPRQAINRYSNFVSTLQPSALARIGVTTTFSTTRDTQGHRGMAITNANTQSGLSVVTPQYSKWKFRPAYCKRRDTVDGESEAQSVKVVATMRSGMSSALLDEGWPALTIYLAGGVDFQPIFFSCVPTLYVFGSPSADDTF